MTDKLLELAGIVVAGAAIWFVAENNMPAIKRAISNVIPSPSRQPQHQPQIIPVSTTTSPWEPTPHKGACPPGMYEDWTDGILHCHSAGGTRELAPNVKPLTPYWQNAWGLEDDNDTTYIDNDEFGYSGKKPTITVGYALPPLIPPGGPTLPAPTPEPQTLTGPITSETHPSKIKKSANDKIEAQKKRQEEKEKKKKHHTSEKRKETLTLPPGSIYLPQGGDITYPPNSQNSQYRPPTQDNEEAPYPEDTTDVGGTTPGNIPPLQLAPGQDQQWTPPTLQPTSPTPVTPAQPIKVTPPTPISGGGEMVIPPGAKLVQGTQWHPYAGNIPCKKGNLGSGLTRDTCRYQADLTGLYRGDYMISATVDVGSFSQGADHHGGNCTETGDGPKNQGKGSCGARLEITSGGPGSHKGACCGFSFCINSTDGTMHMEEEGAARTVQVYCDDSKGNKPCTRKGNSVTGGASIYGKRITIQWVKQGGRYGGAIQGPGGRIPAVGYVAARNPEVKVSGGNGGDSTRIRIDSAGLNMNAASFHGLPKVYTLSQPVVWTGGYSGPPDYREAYGDLGYIGANEYYGADEYYGAAGLISPNSVKTRRIYQSALGYIDGESCLML